MEGNCTIIAKEDYEKHTVTPEGTAEIINKYKDPVMEVNVYILKKDGNFHLSPPKNPQGMKSYFIEEGRLYSMETKAYHDMGSMIILNPKDELFNVTAIKDTYLLVHSLQDDSYEATEKNFKHIHDILVQIQRKDAYTHDHSQRVYKLSRSMAEKLDFRGAALQNLLWAAKYHDIGKVFVPDEILNKPGALTKEEFETMQEHTTMGRDLILQYFNQETYEIICQHHERLDGSGYPQNLRNEEIRKEAKILAICDSFDAMTTDRVYKKGKTKREAIEELKSLKNRKYDEELLKLFIEVLKLEEEEEEV
ncbi:HD-GYP domain-containing protein [Isachenkonia alkalipeptolytica]|uniref:HD domain-containing protein n=1 Tax=Isachenkonia alkalipeptolytica TaxID=2565777 RepID=A0AA43XHH1_9CLOT|nr:HD domain-containing phosphohydrolase [Isachenkonia alkalipeptolytica]NBG86942.1 HD domain-containing protein [Isachenkonia alkalipeptolytica]